MASTQSAEKVAVLGIERDYKKYLYYINREGDVCSKPKAEVGDIFESNILVPKAITREIGWLYFVDKDGDVSRCRTSQSRKRMKI